METLYEEMTGPGLQHSLEDYLVYLTHIAPSPMVGTSIEISLAGETPHKAKEIEITN